MVARRKRLAHVASALGCAAATPHGEFDSHGDNELRLQQVFDVAGKVALVTGGSIGIGRMIAEGLAINGCKVYITSRKLQACEATAAELNELCGVGGGDPPRVIPFASNLADVEGCQTAADYVAAREEKLHILVNNAGATWGGKFDEYPDSAWQRVMDLNVRGVFNLTQKCASLLSAAGVHGDPARVINISSVASFVPAREDSPVAAWAYSASKAAVTHMSVGLAKALGKRNISTNVICPGLFMTKMNAHLARDEETQRGTEKMNPLGRNGLPADMAGPALFLCSRAGAYVNGAVLPVDGGMHI